jgi:predicted phage terminase large subunit-like protein
LKAIEEDVARGPAILYPQYLMNPIVGKQGLASESDLVWIPSAEMAEQIYPRLSLHLTVDLAGMEPAGRSRDNRPDNDYTAMTLHGFTGGVLYVPMIWHGRFTPQEVIELLFQIAHDHPRLQSIKIEKEAHSRVLLPFLKREMAKRSKWLPFTELRRDNRTSKQQRIGSLQPWFHQKAIRFVADLPCRLQLINEILRFPKYQHDDILDTLADAMQNREGGVTSDVIPLEREMLREGADPITMNPDYRAFHGLDSSEDDVVAGVDSVTGW